ncbi:hypothetical protein [Streptomyces sp. NPDC047061]|uniref:hypothetical protein n=1 Tax=Streptomyces sp. NPDC047061 TaxID=3154605 RepID=UPI0033C4B906
MRGQPAMIAASPTAVPAVPRKSVVRTPSRPSTRALSFIATAMQITVGGRKAMPAANGL